MKSHELAKFLLERPNSDLHIDTVGGRKPFKLWLKSRTDVTIPQEDCLVMIIGHRETTD